MLDAAAIASGIAAGVASDQTTNMIDRITGRDNPHGDALAIILLRLKNIDEALNPNESPNIDRAFALQPYPYEYVTDAENHGRAHISIFFAASTPARFDIPGVGTYLKTVGPGWVQCDLPGSTRISTTDSNNHGALVSYRDDPLGAAL